MKKLFVSFLLSFSAVTAHAVDFFAGGDLGLVLYPDFVTNIDSTYGAQANVLTSTSTQQYSSLGFDIRGGAWFNNHIGAELGYDNLGSISGTTTITSWPAFAVGVSNWTYKADAFHVAALAGSKKIFARVGLQQNNTTAEGNYAFGGGSFSRKASSVGVLLGVGSNIQLGSHVALQISLNYFDNVKFVDMTNFNNDLSKGLLRLSFGAAYTF